MEHMRKKVTPSSLIPQVAILKDNLQAIVGCNVIRCVCGEGGGVNCYNVLFSLVLSKYSN
mgnify:CR=1 FL=1